MNCKRTNCGHECATVTLSNRMVPMGARNGEIVFGLVVVVVVDAVAVII